MTQAGDHATPNLPSRDFVATAGFYASLGFATAYRDEGWMILKQGGLTLEFFPHPGLVAEESWFSCCLRVDDLAAIVAAWRAAGLPEGGSAIPRLHPPEARGGVMMAALIDPDGTLLRLIQN